MAHLSAKAGGRRPAWVILLAGVSGACLAGWIVCARMGDADRAWRALLINFIFFTPMTAGMVVWPAAVMASRGRWAEGLERRALAGVAFAPATIVAFAALVFGRAHWAGWMRYAGLPNAAWLNSRFLFARDGAALLIFWALAAWFVARMRRERPKVLACWLAFAYAMVFTLLGFDLVMALDPHWFSTLFGGYFFVSGFYAALLTWALMAALGRPEPEPERLHDLGKLVVALSLLTAYMMFSQLIVLWYENLPSEAHFLVPRLRFGRWGWVSAALLALVYLGPLVVLLTRWAKRKPKFLAGYALIVLAGLWMERWWLVTPTLGGALAIGWPEVSSTAAFVALLALTIEWFLRRAPRAPASKPARNEAAPAEEAA
jgi:hypothetical protein